MKHFQGQEIYQYVFQSYSLLLGVFLILSLVDYCFSHSVDRLLPLVLSLLKVDVHCYLLPSRCRVELFILLDQLLLVFKILFSSLLLLLFLALEKFLNNTFTLIFAGLFIFILLVLKISNKRYGFGSEFLLDLLFLLPNFAGKLIINFYVGG